MTSTKLPAGEYDDGQQRKGAELASFLTDGAMTKDFTPTTWPISGACGDAEGIDVLAVRYIELDGAEMIDAKIRLDADNARRLAVALIFAAAEFDGRGVLRDDVRRAIPPRDEKKDAA